MSEIEMLAQITTMKNEHGKLLKKCGLPIKTDSVNSNEEVTRWLTTVEVTFKTIEVLKFKVIKD